MLDLKAGEPTAVNDLPIGHEVAADRAEPEKPDFALLLKALERLQHAP